MHSWPSGPPVRVSGEHIYPRRRDDKNDQVTMPEGQLSLRYAAE